MDDEFDEDPEFLAALAASEAALISQAAATAAPRQPIQQAVPQKISQPTPQRLDHPRQAAAPAQAASASAPKIVQPTPQALPNRWSGAAIQVSPRQKGNPVLACLKNIAWEYSDIPADYVLGVTTCALFLSLKYHRLHPEYVYTRIGNLQGRYTLRVVLVMVDIPNHEDPLKELSKTSLVNDVTLILCWSAQEVARYLELYKSLEHASAAAIKGRPPATYSERVVEFVTVPRGINKVDAVTLVSSFGTVRNAVNADPEAMAGIPGWGQRKVRRWVDAVEEPFRAKKAARRTLKATPGDAVPLRDMVGAQSKGKRPVQPSQLPTAAGRGGQPAADLTMEDQEEAMMQVVMAESRQLVKDKTREQAIPGSAQASDSGSGSGSGAAASGSGQGGEGLSEGVAAALARLRQGG